MKAVIIAGGLGTRLRPLTNNTPKPMLPIGEKPILEHLVNWTKKGGIKSVILCVSYLKESIEDYFGDGEKFGVKIEYAISKKQLATAGQLKTAEKFIDDDFVCMYGDSIFNFKAGDIPWFLFLGLVPSIFGHNLLNYAVKYITPTAVSAVPLGEPIIASIFGLLLFGEAIPFGALLGGPVVLIGVYIIINNQAVSAGD